MKRLDYNPYLRIDKELKYIYIYFFICKVVTLLQLQ